MLREPLEDLCISRPKSRLTWGIEMPFDRDFVTYVWFDALINYVSAAAPQGESVLRGILAGAEHFIAKDILKPHGVYWPTMLMAAGLPLYRPSQRARLLDGRRRQDVEEPRQRRSRRSTMNEKYGNDAFRYFLLRESVFGLDADFREETLVTRYNADLANNIGNLVSRTLSMLQRYFQGALSGPYRTSSRSTGSSPRPSKAAEREIDEQMATSMLQSRARGDAPRHRSRQQVHRRDRAVHARERRPTQMPRVGAILRQPRRVAAANRSARGAVLPDTAARIVDLLERFRRARCEAPADHGGTGFPAGHRVKPSVVLFPRIEPRR